VPSFSQFFRRRRMTGITPHVTVAFTIRTMRSEDLAAVDRVQCEAYLEQFHEDVSVFGNKLQRFPTGCWVCVINGEIVGYMFSHAANLAAPPGLNAKLGETKQPDDCYFIHDVAVRTSHRGLGIARALLEQGLRIAEHEGHDVVALIAVQRSERFWERFGFRALDGPRVAVDHIRKDYGESARYMARRRSTSQRK
jgi:ribosomal protein S18 acetylase RimI-like enzyme